MFWGAIIGNKLVGPFRVAGGIEASRTLAQEEGFVIQEKDDIHAW